MLFKTNPRDTKYYLIQYNENNYRLLKIKYKLEKGWEICQNFSEQKSEEEIEENVLDIKRKEEETTRCSLSRTKSRIRELALCNNFEYFGTITINGFLNNRYELDECQNRLKKTLRRLHDRNNSLKYLIITEKHQDGAFHFHGLFSGLDLSLNEYNYFYNEDFSRDLGYNSFSLIRDYNKTCNYITKYITKECVKNSHNQVFIRSKGLRVASKEEISPIELGSNWKFENDFCCIYDFDLASLNELDKNIVMNIVTK